MKQPQEMQVWSLGWEDPLEKEMAPHSRILAWRSPRTEEPGGLQSMGWQRGGHNLVAKHSTAERQREDRRGQGFPGCPGAGIPMLSS